MLLDRIIAFCALATLVAYLAIFVLAVPKPALIVTTLLVLGLAAWDFWSQLSRDKK